MFYDAEAFNQPIGNWDVKKVNSLQVCAAASHVLRGHSRRSVGVEAYPLCSDGVPPTHWVAHQGRYHVHGGGQEDASSWGKPFETHMALSSSRWTSFYERGTPVGGRTVQGILLPMCTPLMATLVKGHLP